MNSVLYHSFSNGFLEDTQFGITLSPVCQRDTEIYRRKRRRHDVNPYRGVVAAGSKYRLCTLSGYGGKNHSSSEIVLVAEGAVPKMSWFPRTRVANRELRGDDCVETMRVHDEKM